tara:strand:+ start:684 stop:1001 length:318 start_codon:yes stop_codon:yes gene_type:complete
MATLSNKIKTFLGTEVDFLNDVKLQNDGNGDYIKKWNLDTPQPTEAELNAVEDEADKLERNNIIIAKRKSLYGTWEKQLEEINEQGLDAWKERIAQIKADNPKES